MTNEEQAPAWAQPLIEQCKFYEKQIRELEEEQEQQRKKKEPEKKEEPVDPDVIEAIMSNISGFPSTPKEKKTPSLSSKLPADIKRVADEIMKFL